MTMISFVSSNSHKYDEASIILTQLGLTTNYIKSDLIEIQSESLEEIAQSKAHDAFLKFNTPVLVEDDGLFITGLNEFPGPFSSYVHKTIGVNGILRLLHTSDNRDAKFVAVVAYDDGVLNHTFRAQVCGTISKTPVGDGWGYDPIFVPEHYNGNTYAEMDMMQKILMSHRTSALKIFASWYEKHA